MSNKGDFDDTDFVGEGGETHQISHKNALTTQQGVPVSDDQNTLKVGSKGPILLEDNHFREKLFHFDHERIPERVVHARGFGAHGFFENYDSLSTLTRADLFQRAGEKTPVFVRFSTVAGSKGSSDLARDVRGFAVKFYTQEGNWDLVGNNIPIFFIQDPIKFPDLIHAAKEEPDSGFPQAQTAHDNFWDFIALMPESMHMIMWVMSDRAIPRGFRFMEGFGVHTFRLINADQQSTFVKFHWKPKLGLQSVTWDEALKINGLDPDFHRRDLWKAIQDGLFPEWELGFQLFDDEFIKKFPFDVLDATKLIPEEEVPIRIVGRLVLNKCVDNFFAETEQVAFCTQNIVSGIDFTDDPLLQGRNFSYLDTQLKRLGSPNFTHLPINAPKCPLHVFQQDGHMAVNNPVGRVNYEPNSWVKSGKEHPQGFSSYTENLEGNKYRKRSISFADHYSQARQFYISQTKLEQHHIAKALSFELSKVEKKAIRLRVLSHLLNIHDELAIKVKKLLGLNEMPTPAPLFTPLNLNLKASNTLSIIKNAKNSFTGRKLGIFLMRGADAALLMDLLSKLRANKINFDIIGENIGGVLLSDHSEIEAAAVIAAGHSVLYDAIVILGDTQGVEEASHAANVKYFVLDAFAHLKFIAYSYAVITLFKKIDIFDQLDKGCILIENKNHLSTFLEKCANIRFWQRSKIET